MFVLLTPHFRKSVLGIFTSLYMLSIWGPFKTGMGSGHNRPCTTIIDIKSCELSVSPIITIMWSLKTNENKSMERESNYDKYFTNFLLDFWFFFYMWLKFVQKLRKWTSQKIITSYELSPVNFWRLQKQNREYSTRLIHKFLRK